MISTNSRSQSSRSTAASSIAEASSLRNSSTMPVNCTTPVSLFVMREKNACCERTASCVMSEERSESNCSVRAMFVKSSNSEPEITVRRAARFSDSVRIAFACLALLPRRAASMSSKRSRARCDCVALPPARPAAARVGATATSSPVRRFTYLRAPRAMLVNSASRAVSVGTINSMRHPSSTPSTTILVLPLSANCAFSRTNPATASANSSCVATVRLSVSLIGAR